VLGTGVCWVRGCGGCGAEGGGGDTEGGRRALVCVGWSMCDPPVPETCFGDRGVFWCSHCVTQTPRTHGEVSVLGMRRGGRGGEGVAEGLLSQV
jgi:hypothetical protein